MKTIYEEEGKRIYLGNSFVDDFNELCQAASLAGKRTLLISGTRTIMSRQEDFPIELLLSQNGANLIGKASIKPNPRLVDAEKLASEIKEAPQMILSVGGGSSVDFSKLIKAKFFKDVKILSFYSLPGSGAIVSPFIIYDNHEFKVGDLERHSIPDLVYVNKNMVESSPLSLRVGAACDIFSHAVESSLSRTSNEESRSKAQKALSLLFDKEKIEDISVEDFILADVNAGLAERVGVVLFPHAAGHYLTYKKGIPHCVATMYFARPFLELLAARGIKVDEQLFQVALCLEKELLQAGTMPKVSLASEEKQELLDLLEKYMNFVFKNCPAKLSLKDYRKLI